MAKISVWIHPVSYQLLEFHNFRKESGLRLDTYTVFNDGIYRFVEGSSSDVDGKKPPNRGISFLRQHGWSITNKLEFPNKGVKKFQLYKHQSWPINRVLKFSQ